MELVGIEAGAPLNRSQTFYSVRENFDNHNPIIVHLVLVIFGLSSNLIVATIIAGNRSMHTAANCYVFSIIFSDFIVLSDILFNLLTRWFKWSNLHVDGSYIDCMTLEASVLTIVVFAIERYAALCSLKSKSNNIGFGLSNGIKSILIIWSAAATFPAMELNLNLHFLRSTQALIFSMSTTMFLLLPTVVIVTMAVFILIDTRSLKNNVDHDVSKVFVSLTMIFYVSMAPYRMVSLVRFMAPTLCCSQTVLNGSYLIVELSAAVNPILYGFVSKHFRAAFKETLCSFCSSCNRRTDGTIRTCD